MSNRKWNKGLSFKILEAERNERDLTKREFCKLLGVSEGGYRLWRMGQVPTDRVQEKIQKALGSKPKAKPIRQKALKKLHELNPRATALEYLNAGQLDELIQAAQALQTSLRDWAEKA